MIHLFHLNDDVLLESAAPKARGPRDAAQGLVVSLLGAGQFHLWLELGAPRRGVLLDAVLARRRPILTPRRAMRARGRHFSG